MRNSPSFTSDSVGSVSKQVRPKLPPTALDAASVRSTKGLLRGLLLVVMGGGSLLFSCSSSDNAPPMLGGGQTIVPTRSTGICYPETGCPCDNDGSTKSCGLEQQRAGNEVHCLMGVRTCTNGVWGACEGNLAVTVHLPSVDVDYRLEAKGTAAGCANMPCDPQCQTVPDDSTNYPVPSTLDATHGITIKSTSGSCYPVTVTATTPASSPGTVYIADMTNPLPVASQQTIQFKATCPDGTAVSAPQWAIRSADFDYAGITSTGLLTIYVPIAKDIPVYAHTAGGDGTVTAHVRVKITPTAPSGCTASTFTSGNLGADVANIMYPYAGLNPPVVFPQKMTAPLVQWNTGGKYAKCVKVTLCYPSGTCNSDGTVDAANNLFSWSKIYAGSTNDPMGPAKLDPTQPAIDLSAADQAAWNVYSASAGVDPANPPAPITSPSGIEVKNADIMVQRVVNGESKTRLPEIASVRFANASLRGTVYYTEYKSWFKGMTGGLTSAPTTTVSTGVASSSPTCPVGWNTHPSSAGSTVRSLDVGSPGSAPVDAFNGRGGCPVCHSLSSDGKVLITTGNMWQGIAINNSSLTGTSLGYNSVASGGVLNSIADPPQYSFPWDNWSQSGSWTDPIEDSRGWAYGAMTPDGKYTLQGPNYWGNTVNDPGSNTAQNGAYSGSNKRYFLVNTSLIKPSVRLATRGALSPAVDASKTTATTLTANANGALSVDGVSVANGDDIIVKDETTAANNGIYTVTNKGAAGSAKWTLTRRSDANASGEMAHDQRFFNNANTAPYTQANDGTIAPAYYRIVTSANPIVPGTTPIQFAQWTTVRATTTAKLPGASAPTYSSPYLSQGGATSSSYLLSGVLDSVPLVAGMRILVKDETTANSRNQAYNGIYTVATVGSASTGWKLQRAPDFDADIDFATGTRVRVTEGNTNGGKEFDMTLVSTPFTTNTTGLTFAEQTDYASDSVLQGATMMVPEFSADGTKLVYVSGDKDTISGVNDSGWRRGLTVMDFNNSTLTFTAGSKKRLVNTYAATSGSQNTIKWPFFEHDGKGVVYVESDPGEYCSTSDGTVLSGSPTDSNLACYQGIYGSMSPTTRSYWAGRLRSVPTGTSLTGGNVHLANDVLLAHVNTAVDSRDNNKAYQPTILPYSAGGYRWVIFTSQRSYGNQFNALGTDFTCASSLLWMAALDDRAADGTDRSYPAFLVPGQNIQAIGYETTHYEHYVSERGYLVPSPCKPQGTTTASACSVNAECCSGACTIDLPVTTPVTRHCAAVDTCVHAGQACTLPSPDTTSGQGNCCAGTCYQGACADPPKFYQTSFTRDYGGTTVCPAGYHVTWGVFSWHAKATDTSLDGTGTSIVFAAQSSQDDPATYTASVPTVVSLATANSTNNVGTPANTVDVGQKFATALVPTGQYLRVTFTFNPPTVGANANFDTPVLYDWDLLYTCVPAE